VASLVYDLLEWVGDDGRGYEEVMDAWRTSCPRLPVWEEACRLGYVVVEPAPPGRRVAVSDAGRRVLDRPRRQQPEKQRADA
jgi:D-3-phosphoglycerate dehydrogenase